MDKLNDYRRETIDKALDAFWSVVAGRYPHATSGDLSPLATLALHDAAEHAMKEWVETNANGIDPKPEKICP